jgi:hypothetical protein
METHGRIQQARAQQETERVRVRDERKEEQKTGLEALQQCVSVADLQKLWKGPPDSVPFSQSTTSRRQRIIDQLKRLRVVDKVKVPAYSGRGKTIPVIWSILCDLLGLGEIPVGADADKAKEEEPRDEVAVEAKPQPEPVEGDAERATSGHNEEVWNGQPDNFDGSWAQ